MQDEQIESWRQTTNSADKIQHSILGRIKSRLTYSDRVVILDKYFPTTKYCSNCGNMLSLELNDRIYECPVCKRKEDRDNKMPMWVFSLNEENSIVNTVTGKFNGTKVTV